MGANAQSTTTTTAVEPIANNDWIPHLPVSQLTITMYIPTTCVGAVIGRRGSTIASIQKQAQTPNSPPVRVSIVGHNHHANAAGNGEAASPSGVFSTPTKSMTGTGMDSPQPNLLPNSNLDSATTALESYSSSVPFTYTPLDFSDPTWTPVVIRADPLAALTVAQKLEPLCNGSLQDSIVDLPVGRQRHASIVGKRGLTLMQTSADTACRIWVPPKELKLDVLQLEGQLSNCCSCLKVLTELLAHEKTQKATHQAQLVVPSLPSQTKLRSVGRKTDTLIKKRKLPDGDCWQLTILGSSEPEVVNAHAILLKWAEQQQKGGGPSDVAETAIAMDVPTAASPVESTTIGGGRGGKGGGRGGRGAVPGGRGGRGRKGKPRGGGGGGRGNPSNSSANNNNNRDYDNSKTSATSE